MFHQTKDHLGKFILNLKKMTKRWRWRLRGGGGLRIRDFCWRHFWTAPYIRLNTKLLICMFICAFYQKIIHVNAKINKKIISSISNNSNDCFANLISYVLLWSWYDIGRILPPALSNVFVLLIWVFVSLNDQSCC